MQIALLSGSAGWHVRDLQRAAAELGWTTTTLDFRQLQDALACRSTTRSADALLVRTMPLGSLEQVVFRMDVLQTLQQRGLPVYNSPRALETCIDKYVTLARLRDAGLRVPPTIVCQDADAARTAFDELGGDVVVKPLFGSEGRGMVRVSDPDIAWRTFRTLERLETVLYVQQFIPHPGWDVRIFVLRQRVLTAMRRHGHGHWRTNVAQGATAEPFTPPPELIWLALRATAAVGTWAAGVDLLQDADGRWYVIEVNAVPGWKALAPATGIDVARAQLEALHEPASPGLPCEPATLLACLWEATARKAGNVHPTARFADVTYLDFVRSAHAIAPVLGRAANQSLGTTIFEAVRATRSAVGTNTNLGIILLLAPLAHVPEGVPLRAGLAHVLATSTVADASHVYEAIRVAVPGGLGRANTEDVHSQPTQTLRAVMTLAADRDAIALQYATDFAAIFDVGVPWLQTALAQYGALEPALQDLQLRWLAAYPDTLIARKVGRAVAQEVAARAQSVLNLGSVGTTVGRIAYDELDGWLRTDGHRKNPGTTADLITACLFVALRLGLLDPQTLSVG